MNKLQTLMLSLILVFFTGCSKYDALINADEQCSAAWADVEAAYQRRYDLIPNLVAVVKAGTDAERDILVEVMEARNAPASTPDFHDQSSLDSFAAHHNRPFALLQEAYPEIKSMAGYDALQEQIEGSENRIFVARQKYNDAVKKYNAELKRVDGKALNEMTGHPFKPRAYFSATQRAEKAPEVKF